MVGGWMSVQSTRRAQSEAEAAQGRGRPKRPISRARVMPALQDRTPFSTVMVGRLTISRARETSTSGMRLGTAGWVLQGGVELKTIARGHDEVPCRLALTWVEQADVESVVKTGTSGNSSRTACSTSSLSIDIAPRTQGRRSFL